MSMQSAVDLADAIEGFMWADELDLLSRATALTIEKLPDTCIVEVGSYLGRSTTAIAATLRELDSRQRFLAVDPHEGELGEGAHESEPTYSRFVQNLLSNRLLKHVSVAKCRSTEFPESYLLGYKIGMLLVDAQHDLESVRADFEHFEPWLAKGALCLFHDYGIPGWGVTKLVDVLKAIGPYAHVETATTLAMLKRTR